VFLAYLATSAVAALTLMFAATLELRADDLTPQHENVTHRIPH
jgi:hypothetical protein